MVESILGNRNNHSEKNTVFNLLNRKMNDIIRNFFTMAKRAKVVNKGNTGFELRNVRCENLPHGKIRVFALVQVGDFGCCYRIARNIGYMAEGNWGNQIQLIPWAEIPPNLMKTALMYMFEPTETCCFYSSPPNIIEDTTTNIFVCTQLTMEQEYAFIPRVQGEVSWIPNDRRCQIALPTKSCDTPSLRKTESEHKNAAGRVRTQKDAMDTSATITVPEMKPNRKRKPQEGDNKKFENQHNPILCTEPEQTNASASVGTHNDTAMVAVPEIKPKRKRARKEQGDNKKDAKQKNPLSCTDPGLQSDCTLPLLHPRNLTTSVTPLVEAVQLGAQDDMNVIENTRLVVGDKIAHPDPDETDLYI
jgi:hypothetical protein